MDRMSSSNSYDNFLQTRKPFLVSTNGSRNSVSEHFTGNLDTAPDTVIIPPLNTDIRFSKLLPYHKPVLAAQAAQFQELHPHKPHVHHYYAENFSWALSTTEDVGDFVLKKKLIHPIQNQRLCGSCWAVCTAATISDCFVVSGIVKWMPNISSTYIMMCLPHKLELQQQCKGGNPAEVALALESEGVGDISCIDYSWCSDDELCTSQEAARHFASTLGDKLNEKIPTPCGCFFPGKKLSYKIDSGSDVFSIDAAKGDVGVFRDTVKAHIVDFGPAVGGFIVLRNFVSGLCTDNDLNGGIYFDRGDYLNYGKGQQLRFSDNLTEDIVGLHAVSIIGWGLGKNIRYDNDKVGDVPYWHCRNSWGETWGKTGGYFKIAMYPFNKTSQFCKQVDLPGGTKIGSMVLIRATHSPDRVDMKQITKPYFDSIKRAQPDAFYKRSPDDIIGVTPLHFVGITPINIVIGLVVVSVALGAMLYFRLKSRQRSIRV